MTELRLGARFNEALVYAADIHAEQRRNGGDIPYVSHLLGTCSIALEHGADEDEAIAALLHDAVEDQGGLPQLREIERRFGPDVAHIVHKCSDSEVIPKPEWRIRKEKYLLHLERACAPVLLVSASDKLHNARTILCDLREHGEALWSRFNASSQEQLWYYRGLADAFLGRRVCEALARELDRVVCEIERTVAAN